MRHIDHLDRRCDEAERMMNTALNTYFDHHRNGLRLMHHSQQLLNEIEMEFMEPGTSERAQNMYLDWRDDIEHQIMATARRNGWNLKLPMKDGHRRRAREDHFDNEEDDVDLREDDDRSDEYIDWRRGKGRHQSNDNHIRNNSVEIPQWNPICGPGKDPIPPLRSRVAEPITIVDKEKMPIHQFFLTDFNMDPASAPRIKEANAKARQRREQVGGDLIGVFRASQESNKPALVHLEDNPSKRGEIFVTDFNRHDLLEVCKTVNWRAATVGSKSSNWRLLGVGTGMSENRLYLIRGAVGDAGLIDGLLELLDSVRKGEWTPIDIDQIEETNRRVVQVEVASKGFASISVGDGKKSVVAESSNVKGRSRLRDAVDPIVSMTDKQARNYAELIVAQQNLRKKDLK
jgi:hypothetical protein